MTGLRMIFICLLCWYNHDDLYLSIVLPYGKNVLGNNWHKFAIIISVGKWRKI